MEIETKNGYRFIWPYPRMAWVFDGSSLIPIGPFPTEEIAYAWGYEHYAPNNTDWVVHDFAASGLNAE